MLNFLFLLFLTFVGSFYVVTFEEFTPIDAVYWSVATYTTVGYGDLGLSNAPGMSRPRCCSLSLGP